MTGLRRWLTADWQLMLVGLGVAVALWVYVHGERTIQLTLSVPLEFRNPPHGLKLSRRTPGAVEVRLEARREVIPKLLPRSVRAVVDLTKKVAGRRAEIVLGPDHILRPAGVAVLSIEPASLTLEFEGSGD